MSMKETMDKELEEAIASLQRANDLLMRIFNTEVEINCSGCGEPYEGEGLCLDCRCSDTCGCTEEEKAEDERDRKEWENK